MSIQELTQKSEEIYKGSPWHGSPLRNLVSNIPEENFNRPVNPSQKTIAHLLEHMLAWKYFAIQKLKDDEHFDVRMNTEEDWPEPQPRSNAKSYYLERLDQSHQELLSLLGTKSEDWVNKTTSNKPYTNDYLMQGIVEHDLYHSGQIGIFNALLRDS